ncbi:Alpha-mannosidase [Hondaea fermentalgiana]|uniref:Alpha-mannosidase n=1 Tax=Hondaea fermentalgiana TaxID=2315210 RepID=A0A2R5GPW9_9STRA|nr:Alpha-mannosidase [Hondaea fermentalgiana]|eukprot:GBG29934.1 Alpha-mannosidase [Hondaea fermentalgiana]
MTKVLRSLLLAAVLLATQSLRAQSTRDADDDRIHIHVVAHTHDDTGWIMTVDQYFEMEVRYILDTVVDSLRREPKRKFNYVEMAFFSRWWEEQNNATRADVRQLVKEGRLQFLNGGWCMHDEAAPLALEMIDQTTRGHQFILKIFGPDAAPSVTWQVDPFGHTNTQAWLLGAEAGMPAMFWARMNAEDREARRRSQQLEYVWRGSRSNGAAADIFGGEIWGRTGQGMYNCPVDFEDYAQAATVVDNPERHDYNIQVWVDRTVQIAQLQAADYRTRHIMWACGKDFAFKNAGTWFTSLDKIIRAVNADGRVRISYSTPLDYVRALHAVENVTWSVREDDLMPLHEKPHMYWTGYFASRVAIKRLIRKSSALLQTARQIAFAANVRTVPEVQVRHGPHVGTSFTDSFESALALSMHHDGISGTEKQAVANDYAQRLSEAREQLDTGISLALQRLTGIANLTFCPALNISLCSRTTDADGMSFTMVAWNPLSTPHTGFIASIPVRPDNGSFRAKYSGQKLFTQLVPIDAATRALPQLYINRYGMSEEQYAHEMDRLLNNATHNLLIQVDLPPMQASVINVEHVPETQYHPARQSMQDAREQSIANATRNNTLRSHAANAAETQSNETSCLGTQALEHVESNWFRLEFDVDSGALRRILNKQTNVATNLTLTWGFYESAAKSCTETGSCTSIHHGSHVTEVRQKLSDWVSHVIRLTANSPYVEVEYTVGPIPIEDNVGKEVIVRYSTDLDSDVVFSTDSNGLEMQARIRDQHPASYPAPRNISDEHVAGNYYPVGSMISITEPRRAQFTVVTDSTQGGTSLHGGEVELMVHRRVLHDDNKGVKESLNETMCGCNGGSDKTCHCSGLVVRGVHHLVFDTPMRANATRRLAADRLHFPPLLSFSAAQSQSALATSFGGPGLLADELPPMIRLLSVCDNYEASLGANTLLIRLQHIYSVDEHDELSMPVNVSLVDLFKGRSVVEAYETTVTGNMRIEDKPKFNWRLNKDESTSIQEPARRPFLRDTMTVEMGPMQIRTFVLRFAPHASSIVDI